MCDVSGEVSIFVAFLSVSCVNVPLSWTNEISLIINPIVQASALKTRLKIHNREKSHKCN